MDFHKEQELKTLLKIIEDQMPTAAKRINQLITEIKNNLYYRNRDYLLLKQKFDELKEVKYHE